MKDVKVLVDRKRLTRHTVRNRTLRAGVHLLYVPAPLSI